MQLCLGKITKQSQTTECSIFPRCFTYVVVAMEPAGSTPDARNLGIGVEREESYHARTWQERLPSRTLSRTRGFFRLSLAPYSLRVHCKTSGEVVEADERATQVEEGFVDVVPALVAHREPPVPRQPRQRALYDPPVPAQPLAGIDPAPSDARLYTPLPQGFATAGEVVGLVGMQHH